DRPEREGTQPPAMDISERVLRRIGSGSSSGRLQPPSARRRHPRRQRTGADERLDSGPTNRGTDPLNRGQWPSCYLVLLAGGWRVGADYRLQEKGWMPAGVTTPRWRANLKSVNEQAANEDVQINDWPRFNRSVPGMAVTLTAGHNGAHRVGTSVARS